MKPIFTFFVFLLTPIILFSADISDLDSVDVFLDRGENQKALDYVNNYLAQDSLNGYAIFKKANVLFFSGDVNAALNYVNTALELEPDNPRFHIGKAICYIEKKYYDLAIMVLDRALELKGDKFDILEYKLQCYSMKGDFQKIFDVCSELLTFKPNNTEYLSLFAKAAMQIGEIPKAFNAINEAIKINPDFCEAYITKAYILYSMEDMDAVCDNMNIARSKISFATKDTNQIISYINDMTNDLCDTTKASYYFQRGIAQYNLNNMDKAIDIYLEGMERFPDSFIFYYFLGNVQMVIQEYQSASENYLKCIENKKLFLKEFLAIKNQNITNSDEQKLAFYSIISSLSEALANINKYKEAEKYAQMTLDSLATIQYSPISTHLKCVSYQILGLASNRKGDYEKSLKYLDKSLNIKPDPMTYALKAEALIFQNFSEPQMQTRAVSSISVRNNQVAQFDVPQNITDMFFGKSKKKEEINRSQLNEAMIICDKVIQLEPQYAYAYLLRAQVKIMLDRFDYCFDARKAEEYGITNVYEILNVNCK